MSRRELKVGTRGSELAVSQTEEVLSQLRNFVEGIDFEVEVMKTKGDVERAKAIERIAAKGVFEKEIDQALAEGELDMAVHSMKDVPTELDGVQIGAVPARKSPRDVAVTKDGVRLEELPAGSVVGTGSPRRQWFLSLMSEDLEVEGMRGNVDTRIRKVEDGEYDGAVLAEAGLMRIGRTDVVSETFEPEDFTPAPGQGALAVMIRAGDNETEEIVREVNHPPSQWAIHLERLFLKKIQAGCRVPIGALATSQGDTVELLVTYPGKDHEKRAFRVRGTLGDVKNLAEHAGEVFLEETDDVEEMTTYWS